MLRGLLLALGLFGLWLLLSGVYKPLWIFLGAGSAIAVTFLLARMDVLDSEAMPIQMRFGTPRYWGWLQGEIIKANLAVTKILLSPNLDIAPSIIRVTPTQKTDVGRVTFANSITLTPGTVTIDADGSEFIVHALDTPFADPAGIADMNARTSAIEQR
ncbi:Na+/H+ antiporter subunit E [Pyruvatibacter sp.]|uniref:Na+/H+ antiporter subunit E n=1 Tax=Pyruvatibacter sp. TaxID=1981328 RepID=UPI0032ED7157